MLLSSLEIINDKILNHKSKLPQTFYKQYLFTKTFCENRTHHRYSEAIYSSRYVTDVPKRLTSRSACGSYHGTSE